MSTTPACSSEAPVNKTDFSSEWDLNNYLSVAKCFLRFAFTSLWHPWSKSLHSKKKKAHLQVFSHISHLCCLCFPCCAHITVSSTEGTCSHPVITEWSTWHQLDKAGSVALGQVQYKLMVHSPWVMILENVLQRIFCEPMVLLPSSLSKSRTMQILGKFLKLCNPL